MCAVHSIQVLLWYTLYTSLAVNIYLHHITYLWHIITLLLVTFILTYLHIVLYKNPWRGYRSKLEPCFQRSTLLDNKQRGVPSTGVKQKPWWWWLYKNSIVQVIFFYIVDGQLLDQIHTCIHVYVTFGSYQKLINILSWIGLSVLWTCFIH